jgi:ABC-type nitrate/sulfonate/bicarbonate transport system substrate-binding protein
MRWRRWGALVLLGGWLTACSGDAAGAPPKAAAPGSGAAVGSATSAAPAASGSSSAAPAGSGTATAPAAPAAAAPTAPRPADKIGVTFSSRTPNQLPLWLAYERGYFTQNGLEVDELPFLSSTLAGQGIISNSVQFGLIGTEGIDLNLEAGGPVTHYVAGVTPKLVFKVIAQPDIRRVEDLRGKTVAATRQGSVTDFLWRKVLDLNGMQLGRDVDIAYPGSTDGAYTATLAGQIAATPVTTPLDIQAEQQGLHILLDVEKLNVAYLMGGVVVRPHYAAAHPDVVERYLRAHLQGVATTLNDPEAALPVLGKYMQVEDRELQRAGYETFRPTFTRDQLVPEDAVIATLNESPRPNAKGANPHDFYDNSYLERLKQGGFVDGLYAGR